MADPIFKGKRELIAKIQKDILAGERPSQAVKKYIGNKAPEIRLAVAKAAVAKINEKKEYTFTKSEEKAIIKAKTSKFDKSKEDKKLDEKLRKKRAMNELEVIAYYTQVLEVSGGTFDGKVWKRYAKMKRPEDIEFLRELQTEYLTRIGEANEQMPKSYRIELAPTDIKLTWEPKFEKGIMKKTNIKMSFMQKGFKQEEILSNYIKNASPEESMKIYKKLTRYLLHLNRYNEKQKEAGKRVMMDIGLRNLAYRDGQVHLIDSIPLFAEGFTKRNISAFTRAYHPLLKPIAWARQVQVLLRPNYTLDQMMTELTKTMIYSRPEIAKEMAEHIKKIQKKYPELKLERALKTAAKAKGGKAGTYRFTKTVENVATPYKWQQRDTKIELGGKDKIMRRVLRAITRR